MKAVTNYFVCRASGKEGIFKVRQIVCRGVAHNPDRQAKTLHAIAREEKRDPKEYKILYILPGNDELKQMFCYPEKAERVKNPRKKRDLKKVIERVIFSFDNHAQ